MRLLLLLALIIVFMPRDGIDRAELLQKVSGAYDWTASLCDRDPEFCAQASKVLDNVLVKSGEAMASMEDAVRRNLAASNLGRMPADGQSLDGYAITSLDHHGNVAASDLDSMPDDGQSRGSYAMTSLDHGTLTSEDLTPPWRGRPRPNPYQ